MNNSVSNKIPFLIVFVLWVVSLSACKNKNKTEAAEFFERGNYHFEKREFERSVELFTEAVEKVPDFADAYNNRGSAQEMLGNQEQALADFQEAVNLDDTFEKAKLNLALSYLNFGKADESFLLLDQIKSGYEDSANYHDALGQYYLAKNNATEAINEFNISLSISPKNLETVTNKGFAYYQNKEFEKAKTIFKEALKIDPNFAFANNNLSAAFAQLNDFETAKTYSKAALVNNSTSILFLNTHILNLLETDNLAEAEELLIKAEKISPDNVYIKRNLAVLLLKQNQFIKSVEILEKIVNENPEVEFCYFYYGVALQKLGKKDAACRQFKRGVILKELRSIEAIKGC